ncbi:hypothetical protein ACOMHN_003626 [Nucella lapillus]
MDVVSLYTSIPYSDGLQALEHYLEKSEIEHLHIPTILRLAELVLSLNSFAFEDDHYGHDGGVGSEVVTYTGVRGRELEVRGGREGGTAECVVNATTMKV